MDSQCENRSTRKDCKHRHVGEQAQAQERGLTFGAPARPTKSSRVFDGQNKSQKKLQPKPQPQPREPELHEKSTDNLSPKPKRLRSTSYTNPLSPGKSYRPCEQKSSLTESNLNHLQARLSALGKTQQPLSPAAAAVTAAPPISSSLSANRHMRRSKSPRKSDKKKQKIDPDTHPLNLSREEIQQLLATMSKADPGTPLPMDVDGETPAVNGVSEPATPSQEAPGAFPDTKEEETNGVNGDDAKSPTPPPHKVPPTPKVDPEACKAAGNKFFKAKDYDRAVQEYTKAVDAEPTNPTYLSNRSAAYISANKYQLALGDSLQASRLDSGNDKILHRLARIYTSLGRPQDALDTYARIPNASATDTAAARKALQSINTAEKQIEDQDGNGNMALWSIGQAKQTLGPGTPMPRTWSLLRAKANLKLGSLNALGEVQGITKSLMRENSNDVEAIVLAGQSYYLRDEKPRQGKSDYERSEMYLRQALSQDPDNVSARNTLRTMKKLERARNEANDVFKRGRYTDAIAQYTECLKIDPSNRITNAKLLGNRALSRMRTKEYDEAKADCDQALKLDPTYTKAKKTRAKATGESGDWEQAVKDLRALAEENPGDAEFAKDLRNAELELKKSKRKDYYKILGVDKDAGDKDIERAYKKKAAVLHPDKTQGDETKTQMFKDCLEAKELLLDPQKRAAYDSGADLDDPMGGFGGGGFGPGMGGFGGGQGMQIDPEMLFSMFGQGGGMGGGNPFGGGGGGGGNPFGHGGGPSGFSFNTSGGRGGAGGGYPF